MKEKQSRNSSAVTDRVLFPLWACTRQSEYISLTYSKGTKAPAQVEGKCRLTTSTWTPKLAGTGKLMTEVPGTLSCYLTTSRSKESHVPCSPPPIFAFKNSSLKPIREFRILSMVPILLAWLCNKPCLCSKLQRLGLSGLTMYRAHELGFDNKSSPCSLHQRLQQTPLGHGPGSRLKMLPVLGASD